MVLDPRILLAGQAPQIDGPMDVETKGLTMKGLALQNDNHKRQGEVEKIELMGRLAAGVNDQASYEGALSEASRMGLDVSQMPRTYDQGLVNGLRSRAISYLDQLKLQNDAENRRDAREERRWLFREKQDEKNESRIDKGVQNLSKDLSGAQDLVSSLDEVERVLGSPVDNFSKDKSGNLLRGGKKVDLPGVSLPGMGRVSFYSGDARGLQNAASTVFNTVLKDRSGAAVTDKELERLKNEFSEGKFNTEPELIDALQRYKRRVATVLKNREAGYKPDVVNRYSEQGGRTSKSFSSPQFQQAGSDDLDNLSDEELEALYNQQVKGTKNAKSR